MKVITVKAPFVPELCQYAIVSNHPHLGFSGAKFCTKAEAEEFNKGKNSANGAEAGFYAGRVIVDAVETVLIPGVMVCKMSVSNAHYSNLWAEEQAKLVGDVVRRACDEERLEAQRQADVLDKNNCARNFGKCDLCGKFHLFPHTNINC